MLKREGVISTWSRGQISAGRDKSQEVSERLSTASIILLLLSANFVASDACYSIEMQHAVERHNAGEASVIPVVLRPMDDWQNTPFGKLVALPSNGVPVTGWGEEHAAFREIGAVRDDELIERRVADAKHPRYPRERPRVGRAITHPTPHRNSWRGSRRTPARSPYHGRASFGARRRIERASRDERGGPMIKTDM